MKKKKKKVTRRVRAEMLGPCSYCGAKAGERCVNRTGEFVRSHAERVNSHSSNASPVVASEGAAPIPSGRICETSSCGGVLSGIVVPVPREVAEAVEQITTMTVGDFLRTLLGGGRR